MFILCFIIICSVWNVKVWVPVGRTRVEPSGSQSVENNEPLDEYWISEIRLCLCLSVNVIVYVWVRFYSLLNHTRPRRKVLHSEKCFYSCRRFDCCLMRSVSILSNFCVIEILFCTVCQNTNLVYVVRQHGKFRITPQYFMTGSKINRKRLNT